MIKILGKNPSGHLKKSVEQSKNYQDRQFNNLTKTIMLAEGNNFVKLMADFIKARKDKEREPSVNIPSVKTNLNKLNANETSITWFGHSSYHILLKNKHVLVDPVFSGYASPFPFMIKSFKGSNVYAADDFENIDVLILTHDHYDHLDYYTLLKLKHKVKAVYCSLGIASHLIYWGFNKSIINEMDWWDNKKINDDIQITATPARHFSGRTFKRAQTLWSSFVLQTSKETLFLGGDSGYGEHFKEIGKAFNKFDIAILECGQYNEKWPMIHMMPEQTAQANIDLNAQVLMPVHWGKFALAYHSWKEPIERLTKKAKELNLTYSTPQIGEQIILGEHLPNKEWWLNINK